MKVLDSLVSHVWHVKDSLLKLIETVLAIVMFCGIVYYGFFALSDFWNQDWSQISTVYGFIAAILTLLLGFEIIRLILVHSILVVMELMLLIIARKMLLPDISALDLVYCSVAFAIVIVAYYLYALKPLKSLDDLHS